MSPRDGILARLSREERGLLFERLRARKSSAGGPGAGGEAAAEESAIPRRPRDGSPFPASFSQRRLWLIDRLDRGNPAYNVAMGFRAAGPLDPAALRASLQAVVDRHEALRTTFREIAGNPVQVVAPRVRLPFTCVDLSPVPGRIEREAEVVRICREEARRRFDLSVGPLVAATLLRLSPEEHLLIAVMHHIVSDGWSLGVLNREVGAVYTAIVRGETPALPELRVQYPDYAAWQQERFSGERLASRLAVLKRRLSGLDPDLGLPADRPRPPRPSGLGAVVPLRFERELVEPLRALGRTERGTLFLVLLAAWQTLLHRWGGRDEVVVGAPIANRERPETAALIGFFTNTLLLRGDLSGDPSFRELMGRLREVAAEAYTLQDVPFELLVQELRPDRAAGRSPLFRTAFTFLNTPDGAADLDGLRLEPIQVEHGTAKFDLTLGLFETRDGLIGSIEYATDLFERPTMETLAADLRAILAAAAADPSARLSRLSVAGPPERPTPAIPATPTTPATPAAPAGRLSQLSREARALLFERLQRQRAARAEGRIPRRPRTGEPFPLSFSQERLWFIHRLQPGTGAYNVPVALEIRGPLVRQGLEAGLGEVVRRHESLRTVFADRDGRSVQVILPELRPPLPQIDLGDVPAGLREREVRRIAEEEAIRPFDLERGPLLRALMVRREPERHALVLVVHHIVSDGWSQGLLVQELVAAYGAALEGRPSPLPELPIQYPDFAAWQRERLAGGALEEQLAYWRERLDGAPRFLELPTDRPRPPIQTFGGRDLPFQVPESTLRGLQAVARGREATLFMVLLAAFQALLSRLTGQRDLVVGTPIANRTRDELAPLIGFFVNTLALRIDLSGDPTFEELLGRVRRGALDSYAHQDFPFERLVEALRPERHLSHTPLFQVMFALQNAPSARAEVAGIAVAPVEFMIRSAIFDLELSFAEGDGGLGGSFRYNCDLFDRATILRFIGHLQELLAAVARDGGLRLAALPLLTTAQRHQLLEEWNDTGAGPAADVLAPFEEQAAARPGAEALSAGDRRVTYGELDRWANRLAHRLRALGVGPDTVVGLLADRSVELAVGLLGILKAGGAYLPLDPGLPAARLAFLLEDSGAPFAVAPERLAGELPAFGGRLLLLDAETEGGREERPEPVAGPDDLACVTYASETGGRPKAVLVERGSLASRLAAARRRFGFGHSLDILVSELLSPLLAGGSTRPVAPRPALDVPRLAGELRSAIHDS